MSIKLVLLIVALVLFALAAFGVGSPKFNLQPAGLFCVVLAFVLERS